MQQLLLLPFKNYCYYNSNIYYYCYLYHQANRPWSCESCIIIQRHITLYPLFSFPRDEIMTTIMTALGTKSSISQLKHCNITDIRCSIDVYIAVYHNNRKALPWNVISVAEGATVAYLTLLMQNYLCESRISLMLKPVSATLYH